jgi:protein-S-isoprenylcysteine O-methyltransferase Ste14
MSFAQLLATLSGYLLVLLLGAAITLPYAAAGSMRGSAAMAIPPVRLYLWTGGAIVALALGHGLSSRFASVHATLGTVNASADSPFSIIFSVFAAVVGGIRIYFRWTTRRARPVVRDVDWHDRAILVAAFVCMVPMTLMYLFTPLLSFADFPIPRILAWVGVVLLVPAAWLFWRSHADLGSNWSMNVQAREGHKLVSHGVYSRVRHPMYAALLMAGIGLTPALHNGVLGPAMLAVSILFVAVRAPREERFLLGQFGDAYRDYVARTGRVLPRFEASAHLGRAVRRLMEDFGFSLSRTFAGTKAMNRAWPHVPGKYAVLNPAAPVAVTTLGSVPLIAELVNTAPKGLCIAFAVSDFVFGFLLGPRGRGQAYLRDRWRGCGASYCAYERKSARGLNQSRLHVFHPCRPAQS